MRSTTENEHHPIEDEAVEESVEGQACIKDFFPSMNMLDISWRESHDTSQVFISYKKTAKSHQIHLTPVQKTQSVIKTKSCRIHQSSHLDMNCPYFFLFNQQILTQRTSEGRSMTSRMNIFYLNLLEALLGYIGDEPIVGEVKNINKYNLHSKGDPPTSQPSSNPNSGTNA